MENFLKNHAAKIAGTISCFDRVVFKGHLPLNWPKAMEALLTRNGLKLKDFKRFVTAQAERLKRHAKALAEKAGRPYQHLNRPVRKDDLAREIADGHKIREGLVCVLSAVESANTFKLAYGKGRPKIERARRKCLCLYFYFLDRDFGLLHVRIQTWFPFMIQVCLNGHEWLERRLIRQRIPYTKRDNAFLAIADCRRAQRIADKFSTLRWPRLLSRFARRANPLLTDVLSHMDYYWVIDQAEYATDIMFRSPQALAGLYQGLLKHAITCFSAEDVLTFLGRRLNGNFEGEVLAEYKKRWPGARIKHRVKKNWIKMYDKHGSVLRVETVINYPYDFKIRRLGIRQGSRVLGWFPMPKRVSNLPRYQDACRNANNRYLDALAEVPDISEARCQLRAFAGTVTKAGRSYRGFNPASEDDVALLAAVMRGEHAISGFRNKDVRSALFPRPQADKEVRSQSAKTSRLLKRLHVRGLIAKVPRSRRWRVTVLGRTIITPILILHHDDYLQLIAQPAA